MPLTAIINADVVLENKILRRADVVVKDGKIHSVGVPIGNDFPGGIIDGKGLTLSPGFIDIHCHGGGGHDFMDASAEAFIGACELHARHGTTSILPTTLAGDEDELLDTFRAFHESKGKNPDGANMLGLHLEGPYFSREYRGAQDEKYITDPSPAQYRRIFDAADGCILRWSAAPELPGSREFGRFLTQNGIVAAIAHSSATYDDVLAAFDDGFRLVTHLYSGMSSITRVNGFRVPGVVESTYLIDDMYAELIADGCHLPPALLRLAYKCKGADRLALVTDAMRGAGMPEGESVLGSMKRGQPVLIENGVAYTADRSAFAGSVCTADRLVRTMVHGAGIPLVDAVKMITLTPARILGIGRKKGRAEAGFDADLVLFDDNINVKMTMIGGWVISTFK
ncbi:MAG: N-acetylglucosamine-6-phosphate deacetylase [Oscillospiraceae bacterium]|nr:N-acetylglucosamine-6-phosphate deacetylase [Oscillospiraceae bacterium]